MAGAGGTSPFRYPGRDVGGYGPQLFRGGVREKGGGDGEGLSDVLE